MRNRFLTLLLPLTTVVFLACNNDRKLPDANARFLWVSPAGNNSRLPNLFTGPNGQVYMSWVEEHEQTASLAFSVVRETGWSEQLTIASADNWFLNWCPKNSNNLSLLLGTRTRGNMSFLSIRWMALLTST